MTQEHVVTKMRFSFRALLHSH